MLTIPPPTFRKRRGRPLRTPPAPPAPVMLTLVSATFDPGGPTLTLQFNVALDLSNVDGAAFTVSDGPTTGLRYDATGGYGTIDEFTVFFVCEVNGAVVGDDVVLNVTAGNGIAAADDPSATWAGVSGLVLPWGLRADSKFDVEH